MTWLARLFQVAGPYFPRKRDIMCIVVVGDFKVAIHSIDLLFQLDLDWHLRMAHQNLVTLQGVDGLVIEGFQGQVGEVNFDTGHCIRLVG